MRDLLARLIALRDDARMIAATRRPDGGTSEAYHIGFLQGRHAAFEDTLVVVKQWLDDDDERKNRL